MCAYALAAREEANFTLRCVVWGETQKRASGDDRRKHFKRKFWVNAQQCSTVYFINRENELNGVERGTETETEGEVKIRSNWIL